MLRRKLKRTINIGLFRSAKVLGNSLSYRLAQLAYIIRSSNYFSQTSCNYYKDRFELYGYIIESENLKNQKISYLEFGVYKGASIKWFSSNNIHTESSFTGFDSFLGLPQKWGTLNKGYFSTEGQIPQINDNRVKFVKGWFNETLPGFINEHSLMLTKNKIIHFDADLFSSTLYVLTRFEKYFMEGDIVIFDDFFGQNSSEEFRAFLDFSSIVSFKFQQIGKSRNQMAFKVHTV